MVKLDGWFEDLGEDEDEDEDEEGRIDPRSGAVRARIAPVKPESSPPVIVTRNDITPPVTTAVRAPASGARRKAASPSFWSGAPLG